MLFSTNWFVVAINVACVVLVTGNYALIQNKRVQVSDNGAQMKIKDIHKALTVMSDRVLKSGMPLAPHDKELLRYAARVKQTLFNLRVITIFSAGFCTTQAVIALILY